MVTSGTDASTAAKPGVAAKPRVTSAMTPKRAMVDAFPPSPRAPIPIAMLDSTTTAIA